MQILTVPCGMLDVNTYVIFRDGAAECVVIDCGDGAAIASTLQARGLTPTDVLLTHGHFDHITGLDELKRRTGARVRIHADDAGMLKSNRENLSVLTGNLLPPMEADALLQDGDRITAAGITFSVLHTPGHTPGGVCYVLDEARAIFSGDTLFRASIGRTDFPKGSMSQLVSSIQTKLFSLEGDYAVYPGHGEKTTLTFERDNNPYAGDGALE